MFYLIAVGVVYEWLMGDSEDEWTNCRYPPRWARLRVTYDRSMQSLWTNDHIADTKSTNSQA